MACQALTSPASDVLIAATCTLSGAQSPPHFQHQLSKDWETDLSCWTWAQMSMCARLWHNTAELSDRKNQAVSEHGQ